MSHRIALGAALLASTLNFVACSSCSSPAPGAGSVATPSPAPSASTASTASTAQASASPGASVAPPQAALPPCPTFPAPPGSAAPQEPPPPAARACAAQVQASEKKVSAVSKEASIWQRDNWPGIARCVGDAAGSWVLAIDSFKTSESGFSGVYRLVRVTAEGKVIATNLHETFGRFEGGEHHGAEISASLDIDRDGTFEVLVHGSGHYGGGEDSWSTQTLYRLQGNEAVEVPIPVDKKIPRNIEAVTDIDGDGRLDITLRSPVTLDIPCTLDGIALGPRLLLHGTPTPAPGGFSARDEVAQNFARIECASAPVGRLLTTPPMMDGSSMLATQRTALAIGCARLGGASASEVKAQLAREIPADLTNSCIPDLAALSKAADLEPPLKVERLACRP